MEQAFLKIQASGNDFICIETNKTPLPEEKYLPDLAKKICSRRFGVGADGLIVLHSDEEKRIQARVWNPEGLEQEECGAALQCAARYAYDSGLIMEKAFHVFAGGKSVWMEVIDSRNIRQDLGVPLTLDRSDELKELIDATYTVPVVIEDHELSCTPLFLETAHAVFFLSNVTLPLPRLARKIDQHPLFPDGSRVSFVRVFSREELDIRAWYKGGDELYACPRVASAGLIAAVLNGFAEREAVVHLKGGDLFTEWSEENNHVFATGPSDYVFSGNFYFED